MSKVSFLAQLSNGQTVRENTEEYEVRPGERKPWVRFVEYLEKSNLTIQNLALVSGDQVLHLPMADKEKGPKFYSLQYITTLEISDKTEVCNLVDVAAHYDDFELHLIQDLDGNGGYVEITKGTEALAPSPSL